MYRVYNKHALPPHRHCSLCNDYAQISCFYPLSPFWCRRLSLRVIHILSTFVDNVQALSALGDFILLIFVPRDIKDSVASCRLLTDRTLGNGVAMRREMVAHGDIVEVVKFCPSPRPRSPPGSPIKYVDSVWVVPCLQWFRGFFPPNRAFE